MIADLPADDIVRKDMQALMDRMALLASAASRARRINALFGTHQTPEEIAARYAVEDIDLLLAWGSVKE